MASLYKNIATIEDLLHVDLYNMLKPVIDGNPFDGPTDSILTQPVAVLEHITRVLRLMKNQCVNFDEEGKYLPAITKRIQRIATEEYFSVSEVKYGPSVRTGVMQHELTFNWDGYEIFVTIYSDGDMQFSHTRCFGKQCEFHESYMMSNMWSHMNYPLGLFTDVFEMFDDRQCDIKHLPSASSFQEKMSETIWYIFYRLYRAGFVNALKGFDTIPEDEEYEVEFA